MVEAFAMRLIRAGLLMTVAAAALSPSSGRATEGGASLFVPGFHGPMAGFVPPPGFYFETDLYSYSGRQSARTQTQLGGAVVANVKVEARAAFLTPTWVTPLQIFGGNLGFAVSLPFGVPRVSAGALIAAPRFGRTFGIGLRDADFLFGDPIVSSFVGWHHGNFHWQVAASVNIPSGTYQDGELSNLSFNRWIGDFTFAATWFDPVLGLDVSGAVGLEINGQNPDTDYKSGNAIHGDLAITKTLTKEWSVGFLASHYQQISGDGGAGASLGPYKGRTTALGGHISYSFELAGTPITARLKVLREVDVKNRPEGTIGLFSIAFPIGHKPAPTPTAEARVVKH
ncbi:transporter [Bosea sp. BH3]|nr:transporter [Bosea sp. BH3]